jgi:Zn-dependent metalloprotease
MKKLILFVCLMFPLFCFGQQKVLIKNVDKNGNVNHLVFDNSESFIPMEKAKQLLHDTLKLLKGNDFILLKETKDELGFSRQTYQQQFNGIKIEDGLYGVHGRNSKIEYISGEYKNVTNVITYPSISEKEALEKALGYIKATKYRWQIPSEETNIKINKKDSAATFFPKGELLICRDVVKTDSIYRLAYKFDIFSVDPFSHKIYYIDAITGDILDIRDLIFDENANATGTTLYRGPEPIMTDHYISTYRLYETRSSNNIPIHTWNAQHDPGIPPKWLY